jgi:galactose mutarotase-like enzyme
VGDLSAIFLPRRGMLGASLRFRGVELLGRIEDLEASAKKGSTAGIPLLYPWANRLEALDYRTGDRNVELSATSPLLHFDDRGLPMHGISWPSLAWELLASNKDSLKARLDWNRPDLLAIFPFPHQVEMTAIIRLDGLHIETVVIAQDNTVPIGFGFHPYFSLPKIPRERWRLALPAMRRLFLNSSGIPIGTDEPFTEFDSLLGESIFDDLFAITDAKPIFALSGAGLKIVLEFIEGYGYAQIYAPKGKEFIALEPMTAPTNALRSGRDLHFLEPHKRHRTTFRIQVEEIS